MPLGWLTGFMTALNTTWPHVDHLLVNNGMSGGTWGALSEVRDDGGATSVGEACGRAGPREALMVGWWSPLGLVKWVG